MKNKLIFSLLTIVTLLPLQIVNAKETGESLHETKCLGCHDSYAYTRKEKTVKSLESLSKRVKICAGQAAKANWNSTQINSVTSYLNNHFYKFK